MKNKLLIIFAVIVVVLGLSVGSFIGTYNKIQMMDEKVSSNWAQVENQLQRRNDLIPNLVNTVKGYAKHEKDIMTNIAESRSKLSGAVKSGNVKDISKADSEMSGALSRLLVVVENYPQLKADSNFIALQDELSGTENRLAVSRKDYNDSVQELNADIRLFPDSVVAGIAGIKSRDYFKAQESAKEAPKVNFQ